MFFVVVLLDGVVAVVDNVSSSVACCFEVLLEGFLGDHARDGTRKG